MILDREPRPDLLSGPTWEEKEAFALWPLQTTQLRDDVINFPSL